MKSSIMLLALMTIGLAACAREPANSDGNGPGNADGTGGRQDPPTAPATAAGDQDNSTSSTDEESQR